MNCLSLKLGYTGSSESIHVKMPHCWKSRAKAHILMCPSLSRCEAGMNDPVIDLHMLFVSELGDGTKFSHASSVS